ncbi:MAG: radical SAM protein [Candidatus Omnitrophota bacterium]
MKIALISPYLSIASHGIRSLSGYLKEKNVSVYVFFLCLEMDTLPSESLCKKLLCLLKANNVDLIGVSLSTNYFNIAKTLTGYIKGRLDVPIVWGGIHPTIVPEECLEFTDMVCIGEGESSLLELCTRISEGRDYSDVSNLCLKSNEEVRKNSLAPLIQDLDSLPFPDYDFIGHFVWDRNDFYPVNETLFKKYQYIPDRYETLGSRGCPYQCSYCCNNMLHKLYGSKGFLRRRTSESIIRELEGVRHRFPFIKSIYFDDDAMFSRTIEEIELFCRLYKEKVGLPFRVSGVHPLALTKEKLKLFVNAGLKQLKMGIQTGSSKTSRLYNRGNISRDKIIDTTNIINSFKRELEPPIYDFILDNPYERDYDLVESLKLLIDIPKPYELSLFSLTFFPGNDITDKALKEGIIKKERNNAYLKDHNQPSLGYFNALFRFFESYNCPLWIKNILLDKRVIKSKIYIVFFFVIKGIQFTARFKIMSIKLAGDLLHFDFSRIKRKFAKFTSRIHGRHFET